MRPNQISLRLSSAAIIISLLIALIISSSVKNWRSESKIIESDVISYYAYLPAIFIYQDLSLKYYDNLPFELQKKYGSKRPTVIKGLLK